MQSIGSIYFQKLIGQNHIINKKFSKIPLLSSDDEELASFQSQPCHENNNEFSNPWYLFDDDQPEVSGRKKNNVTNERDVNFLPQQVKKKTKRGGCSRGKRTIYQYTSLQAIVLKMKMDEIVVANLYF